MKLSMKSRYGLRALIDLSVNSKNEQVALGSIAERNNISPQYLEQVFASLRKAGIVKSIKGSQGGYFLNIFSNVGIWRNIFPLMCFCEVKFIKCLTGFLWFVRSGCCFFFLLVFPNRILQMIRKVILRLCGLLWTKDIVFSIIKI